MSTIGQIKTKLMSIIDSIDSLEPQNPTSFRWTPEMEAIWGRGFRPTMSGLLAIWEAMHGAAEYEGWIKWDPIEQEKTPPHDMKVAVKLRDGYESTALVDEFRPPMNETNWWDWSDENQIIAYRVVK